MPRPKKHSEVSKEALFEAGLEVFAQKGFHRTRLDDIAKSIGVSRGAIYWHFASKEDFYISLVQHYMGQIEEEIMEILKSSIPASEKLAGTFLHYMERIQANPALAKVKRLEIHKAETWESIPSLQELHSNKLKMWFETLKGLIEEGQAQGELQKALDSTSAAMLMLSTFAGLGELWNFHKDTLDLQKHYQNIIHTMINSMRSR